MRNLKGQALTYLNQYFLAFYLLAGFFNALVKLCYLSVILFYD